MKKNRLITIMLALSISATTGIYGINIKDEVNAEIKTTTQKINKLKGASKRNFKDEINLGLLKAKLGALNTAKQTGKIISGAYKQAKSFIEKLKIDAQIKILEAKKAILKSKSCGWDLACQVNQKTKVGTLNLKIQALKLKKKVL